MDVKVDLDLDADGLSSPVIDLNHFYTYGSVVMPDVVDQKMDDGNQFNIDQVNNMVDNDLNFSFANYSGGAGGSYCEPGASFNMEAKIEGGESKIDSGGRIGARANVASSADATHQPVRVRPEHHAGCEHPVQQPGHSGGRHDLSDDDIG